MQSNSKDTSLDLIFDNESTLSRKLESLHDRILLTVPIVDRIACAIYDAKEDLLKTFINSTRAGEAIKNYQYKLSESNSLSILAKSGEYRVINDIQQSIQPGQAHSNWLLRQNYRSSLTVPMYDNGQFIGFIFFDSVQPVAFSDVIQRDLVLFCSLINMAVSSELSTVRTVMASTQMARDFANLRDFETGAHLERMARYSRVIAKNIAAKHGLSDEFIEHVFRFAPLHDIGKIGIADSILLKPGKLDDQERKIMQSHVEKGVEIINKIINDFGLQKLSDSSVMTNIVECHHEFLDGSGYPRGLVGSDVPIEARIVTTADIFDALTSRRPYKEAWSFDQACAEMHHMVSIGKLDLDCVMAIEESATECKEIGVRYRDLD